MIMNTRLKLFLGNCCFAANGEWISLPQKEEELKNKITNIEKKYGEFIISSYEKTDDKLMDLHVSQYADIYELNEVLQKDDAYLALYIASDEDIEFANEFYINKKYLYFPSVNNTEELGEAIARKGLIGRIPSRLLDSDYINYTQIGYDFECNGIRLIHNLGAVGQISDSDYNKWKHLI